MVHLVSPGVSATDRKRRPPNLAIDFATVVSLSALLPFGGAAQCSVCLSNSAEQKRRSLFVCLGCCPCPPISRPMCYCGAAAAAPNNAKGIGIGNQSSAKFSLRRLGLSMSTIAFRGSTNNLCLGDNRWATYYRWRLRAI